jgi:hypothetical protein
VSVFPVMVNTGGMLRTPLSPTGDLCLDPPDLKQRHMLIIDADEGSTGVARSTFLFSRQGAQLRGLVTRDSAHRLHNNFILSVKKSGLHC